MFRNHTNETVSNAARPTEEPTEVGSSRASRSWDEAIYLMANPFVNRWIGP